MIDFIARWGWWLAALAMIASSVQQGIEGDDESSSLRVMLAVAWIFIALRESELRDARGRLERANELLDASRDLLVKAREHVRRLDGEP